MPHTDDHHLSMPWEQEKHAAGKKAVAYYRHSAQDRQENSVEIQREQVRQFATEHGIEVIAEFSDRGKSGLSVDGRDGFTTMLRDYVQGGKEEFEYVLVLDVSRWGRFQETDLSAYYTGLCIQHGKQVIYTSIGLPKKNDLLHGLHLSIERYRAASYSRELSGKVWKGSAKIAGSGYWAGGKPPYALSRLLLDEQRNPVRPLKDGEHKAIHNQRVVLTAGNQYQIEVVRMIFNAFGNEGSAPEEITERLNTDGILSPGGVRWSTGAVWTVLRNEIYAGVMVWNKTSQKMKSPSHPNPEDEWIKTPEAFEPIVPPDLFYTVQGIIKGSRQERLKRYSEEDMVAKLQALYDRYGMVSGSLISSNSELVSPAAYTKRFGALDLAYQALFREIIDDKRHQLVESLRHDDVTIEQHDDYIVIDGLFSVQIQPAVPLPKGYEACWVFHPNGRKDVDLTIGVLLSCPKQFEVLGCLAFPRMMIGETVRVFTGSPAKVDLFSHQLKRLIEHLRT
jgi:DNA invertase Pin-like site-specific DNA recombinase